MTTTLNNSGSVVGTGVGLGVRIRIRIMDLLHVHIRIRIRLRLVPPLPRGLPPKKIRGSEKKNRRHPGTEKNAPLLGYLISENTPPREKKCSSSSSVVWTVIKRVRDKTLLGPLVRMTTEDGGNGTDIHTFTHFCTKCYTYTHYISHL
jgi:hypothetical protein